MRLDSSRVVKKENNFFTDVKYKYLLIQSAEYLLSKFPFCLPVMKGFK